MKETLREINVLHLAFVESGQLDAGKLEEILERHRLVDVWARFEARYLASARSPGRF